MGVGQRRGWGTWGWDRGGAGGRRGGTEEGLEDVGVDLVTTGGTWGWIWEGLGDVGATTLGEVTSQVRGTRRVQG